MREAVFSIRECGHATRARWSTPRCPPAMPLRELGSDPVARPQRYTMCPTRVNVPSLYTLTIRCIRAVCTVQCISATAPACICRIWMDFFETTVVSSRSSMQKVSSCLSVLGSYKIQFALAARHTAYTRGLVMVRQLPNRRGVLSW